MLTVRLTPAVAILASLLAAAVAHADDKPNFQDHVLPIFRNACNGCHNPDKKKSGLDLTTYAAAMAGSDNGAIVVAGDPGSSRLLKVMTHAEEPSMPPNKDKLPQKELDVVQKWVAGGLLESVGGKAVASAKPAVDLSAVVVSGKPANPSAMPTGLSGDAFVHTSRSGAVESLAASPWAPLLAVGGQKQIFFFGTRSLDLLGVLPFDEGVPRVLQFSRNGNLLLAGGGVGAKLGKIALYDVASGNRLANLADEQDEILAADVSPDQKWVAFGGPSRIVKAINVGDGSERFAIKKHTDWVTAVAISPDGKLLASGDRAGNLYVWEGPAGSELFTLDGHKDGIESLAFRDDSKLLASVSRDGTLKLWDLNEGKPFKSANAHVGGATAVAFAHDGRLVTTGRDKKVKLWDATAGGEKPLSPELSDVALHVAFDDEGQRVFAGDWSGLLRGWTVADGKPLGEASPNPEPLADRLAAADKAVAAATPAVEKADAELKSAREAAAKAAAAAETAEKARAASQQLLTDARRQQARLQALQAATEWTRAKRQLGEQETALAQAQSTAKSAEESAKQARNAVTAFQDARRTSPQRQKELTDRLPQLRAAVEKIAPQAEQATKESAEGEALVAEAGALLQKIVKRSDSSKDASEVQVAQSSARQVLDRLSAQVTADKKRLGEVVAQRNSAESALKEAKAALEKEKSDDQNADKLTGDLRQAAKAAEVECEAKQELAKKAAEPLDALRQAVAATKAKYEQLTEQARKEGASDEAKPSGPTAKRD